MIGKKKKTRVFCRALVGADFFGGTNFGGTAIRREFVGGKRFSFFWRDRFRRFPVIRNSAVLGKISHAVAGNGGTFGPYVYICTMFVFLHIFVAAERAASRFSVVSLLFSIVVPDRKMTNENCFKIGTERTTALVPRKRINDKKRKKLNSKKAATERKN